VHPVGGPCSLAAERTSGGETRVGKAHQGVADTVPDVEAYPAVVSGQAGMATDAGHRGSALWPLPDTPAAVAARPPDEPEPLIPLAERR
jgi:hypothetical protein